jgi:hypothetical protein
MHTKEVDNDPAVTISAIRLMEVCFAVRRSESKTITVQETTVSCIRIRITKTEYAVEATKRLDGVGADKGNEESKKQNNWGKLGRMHRKSSVLLFVYV